jgi:limonene-1,2-epoxide hydrolase
MSNEEQIVRRVLAMWGEGLDQTLESWRQHCTPDLEWWNSARGGIKGLDACLEGIEQMWSFLDVIRVEVPIRNVLTEDGRVIVERSDNLVQSDGTVIYAPVVGVVEFDDDKIARWRDYCDDWMLKRELGGQMTPAKAP